MKVLEIKGTRFIHEIFRKEIGFDITFEGVKESGIVLSILFNKEI